MTRSMAAGGMLVLSAGFFLNCQNLPKVERTQQAVTGEETWVPAKDWKTGAPIVEEELAPIPPGHVNVSFDRVPCGDRESFSERVRARGTGRSGSEARDECIERLKEDVYRGARCDHQVCDVCASERSCGVKDVSTNSISVDCERSDDNYRCTCEIRRVRIECHECGEGER